MDSDEFIRNKHKQNKMNQNDSLPPETCKKDLQTNQKTQSDQMTNCHGQV